MDNKIALGFIETRGFTGIIEASDVMPKTSDVDFFAFQSIGGSYVTAVYKGAVGAVRSAVDRAASASAKVGTFHAANIIPRPDDKIYEFIKKSNELKVDASLAVGMVETVGYTAMAEAADAGVKAAEVIASNWLTIGGGYCTVIFRGNVASVKAAVDAAVTSARRVGNVVSTHIIPRPHIETANRANIGKPEVPTKAKKKFESGKIALSVIETKGYIPIVEAIDSGLKAADVDCMGWYKVGSAYVSTVFRGDVAAVRTALDAGAESAGKVGEIVSTHFIPQPDGSLTNLVSNFAL